jgi:DNA-binding MarR family transcriptional regulator
MGCHFPLQADKSSKSNEILTSGGRHLDAISKNKNLNMNEKCVMHYLAAHQDYTKDFQQWRFAAMQDMADDIGCSKNTIKRTIKTLEEKGYILKQNRAKEKEQLANNYKITEKIFTEYLGPNRTEVGPQRSGVGPVWPEGRACVAHEILPKDPSLDPLFNSSVSSETGKLEKQKIEKEKTDFRKPPADNVMRNIPNKPLPKIESNVFEIKEARKRGSVARARQIISALCCDSNFHQQSIAGVASLILDEYSLEVLEKIFADAVADDSLGISNWNPQNMLNTVKRYAS